MSSAQQYAWLEEEHPDLFARMKRRIEEGRFIPVGGMWVESDNMILPANHWCGRSRSAADISRSISRHAAWHLATGQFRLHRLLAADRPSCRIRLVPHAEDLVERHHQVPAPLVHVGGIDGTRILTHFPPSDTYCSWMSMHELMYSQRNFLDKDLSRNAILLYGFGDGGGGPTREMTARIRRDHDLAGVPKIEFGTPDQLFDRVRKDIVDDAQGETPVFKGELYLELHRATLTAQQDMKRGCRQEESMLRVAEYLCAAARIKNPDYVYPREELDRIWKTLLLNQFHRHSAGSAQSHG